jgi:integrase
MPSCWIERRPRASGGVSYAVRFILGGRESVPMWAGAFPTKREAEIRKGWVRDELAAMRVPRLQLLEPAPTVTFRTLAEQWRRSRIDVAEGTSATHHVNLGRILPVIGDKAVDAITVADVAEFVHKLHGEGLARESIRKTRSTLAMVLDFAGRQPNPARDKSVKLPREDTVEVQPPTAAHVEAVIRLLPKAYRLAAIVKDATGMRVGEIEALTWGDIDEPEGRWRVSAAASKTRKPRWVPVPPVVFDAVVTLMPRDDRQLERQVFDGFGADRFRTSLTRACKAAAVPAFSPHDLRHCRATLWHLAGVPVVEAATWLGHSATEHLKTYAHATLVDRDEVDAERLLRGDGDVGIHLTKRPSERRVLAPEPGTA